MDSGSTLNNVTVGIVFVLGRSKCNNLPKKRFLIKLIQGIKNYTSQNTLFFKVLQKCNKKPGLKQVKHEDQKVPICFMIKLVLGALDLCVPLFACSNAKGKKDVV